VHWYSVRVLHTFRDSTVAHLTRGCRLTTAATAAEAPVGGTGMHDQLFPIRSSDAAKFFSEALSVTGANVIFTVCPILTSHNVGNGFFIIFNSPAFETF
jgi:hypothetical protein